MSLVLQLKNKLASNIFKVINRHNYQKKKKKDWVGSTSLLFKTIFFPSNMARSQKLRGTCPSPQSPGPLCLTHLIPYVSDGFQAWMDLCALELQAPVMGFPVTRGEPHPGDGEPAWGQGILLLRESQELLTAAGRPSFCKELPRSLSRPGEQSGFHH